MLLCSFLVSAVGRSETRTDLTLRFIYSHSSTYTVITLNFLDNGFVPVQAFGEYDQSIQVFNPVHLSRWQCAIGIVYI